jgi:hypothetical protein
MFAAIWIPDFALQSVLRNAPELADRPVALIPEKVAKACIIQLHGEPAAGECFLA